MATTNSNNKTARSEVTRIAIIECAEAMFSEQGIDSVSLRKIGSAIGSSNTSVVIYHFGTKEALIEAIFQYRVPKIEQRRGQLVEELVELGAENDLHMLIRALCLPLFEEVAPDGRHTYAGFLDALSRSELDDLRIALKPYFPIADQLLSRIAQLLPEDGRKMFPQRFKICSNTITSSLRLIDIQYGGGCNAKTEAVFSDALKMFQAALSAPV